MASRYHSRCGKQLKSLRYTGTAGTEYVLKSLAFCENCRVFVQNEGGSSIYQTEIPA